MCGPTNLNTTRHVVVSGAGPAGILATLLLLQRNERLDAAGNNASGIRYHVTLVDPRIDFGQVDPDTDLKKYRSWMLALANHGLVALREIPDMYNDYVSHVGIRIEAVALHLGSKEIKSAAGSEGEINEGYIVDRNFVVAAMARYLYDKYKDSDYVTTLYEHKIQYVDHEQKRVLIRKSCDDDGSNCGNNDIEEFYQDYDLLLGCDGIRSVVRDTLIKTRHDFEMDVGDIFQQFRAVHVKCPANLDINCMHILPNCFPHMMGIALPETGGMLNISMGAARHVFDKVPTELKSDDPQVVADYIEKNFKAFQLDDYMDFAKQWVGQKRWNRTGQAHCNIYHCSKAKVVLMGDAAHATSPSIGMGMNTALRDAQAFVRLLAECDDDLDKTLGSYSQERVKEGNSLTDMALHLYCLDTKYQMLETIHMVVRSALANLLPGLVSKHPQATIGATGYDLADVYDSAKKLGIIDRHRRINAQIRQEFFEQQTGMVKQPGNSKLSWLAILAGGVAAVGVGAYMKYNLA